MARTHSSILGFVLGAIAITSAVACGSGATGTGGAAGSGGSGGHATGHGGADAGSGGADAGPPPKIAEQQFGAFEPWATPIDDYLAVGEMFQPSGFRRSITDLAPFGERMFFGYGDADYNLGEHTPIEMRYFASPDDPAAKPTLIDGEGQGAPQTTPYQSGEEQIDRYRVLDGVLWQAGIDSTDPDELWTQANTTPKGIQGNAYRLDGDTFVKRRTITGGEHVHDLAAWKGAVYGVGSGADTRMEFEGGMIFRYLWRTTDLGGTFETVKRIMHPNPGKGDSRFVHLLPTTNKIYLFGYESVFATNSGTIKNASYDGQTVTDLTMTDPLRPIFPDGTLALPDGTGIVYGVDVSTPPSHLTTGHVGADGSLTILSSFVGSTVVDTQLAETGEIVYLATAGDSIGGPDPTSWDVRVLVADASAPDTTKELVHLTMDVAPISIAYWRGALFLGTNDGKVLKAAAVK